MTYPTLEHVAMEARPYPAHLLQGCETGLCLFAAAFLGHNDAIHFAEAGIDTMCVDTDVQRLNEMSELYPDSWSFSCADAWAYAQLWSSKGWKWDAVSVDTFTGDVMAQAIASRELWTSLARRVVVLGVPADIGYIAPPHGWKVAEFMERSSKAAWLAMVPDA